MHAWAARQDPGSPTGTAIGAWRSYRAVDGPLQTALLAVYVLLGVVPALLVLEEYLDANPAALANHIVRNYDLSTITAGQVRSVLVETRVHELGSAVLAIGSALVFGVGFGRVLQLVHVRAWRITLPRRSTDQARYAAVLLGLYGLILLLLAELDALSGSASWVRLLAAPAWVAVLALFFAWAPRLLTHKQVSWRDLLPGAVLTAVGLVVVLIVSSYFMERWVDLYARDYGGFGVVMAIFFWIQLCAAIVVAAASLSPSLARRREVRERR
jgi:membrane protein